MNQTSFRPYSAGSDSGEAMQTDFPWASKLGVTIQGEAFPHMLCHPVLPYSNWEWVTVIGDNYS